MKNPLVPLERGETGNAGGGLLSQRAKLAGEVVISKKVGNHLLRGVVLRAKGFKVKA